MKRTKEEIELKIKELLKDESNFMYDNYGSLAADEGFYQQGFSETATEATLRYFADWLMGEDIV